MLARYRYEYDIYNANGDKVHYQKHAFDSDDPPETVLPKIEPMAIEVVVYSPDSDKSANGIRYRREKGERAWKQISSECRLDSEAHGM